MANTLVTAADLADFPGAPFPEAVIDAAVAAIRGQAGWHIAPVVTETFLIDAENTLLLLLPTLRLVSVTAVRDMTENPAEVLTGYRMSRAGMLTRDEGWPVGFQSVEVDATHGYTATPPELFSVVAERARLMRVDATVSQESTGPFSVSYRTTEELSEADSVGSAGVLARYTLPVRQR